MIAIHSDAVKPERFYIWGSEGHYRSFKTLSAAEKWARRRVAVEGGSIEVARGYHVVASVRRDALDRVWTDVVDGSVL